MNFLKEFEQEKNRIKNLVDRLYEKKVLDDKEYKEIVDELDNDIVKIAVIGQMNYGKSTFINAFLFHSNYLPTSSTPMTAALSEIKYGEEEKYEIHFFSKDEFEEVKEKEEFKDFLEKAENIPDKDSLFNTTKIISKDEFENYVGADGLYTPIVKMLTIYSPNEVLKEAIVVDTPGFNDPIESREKRAEKFIKNADFVILFLYAGKPFDKTDRDIIVEKLQYLGKAGKVLIVVNKADLLLNEYGTMDAVTDHIKKTLENTIEDYIFSETLAETLRESEIIPISSLMALLARVDEKELNSNLVLSEYNEMFMDQFLVKNREDFEDISNMGKLENVIKNSLKEDKLKILISGIKTKLMAVISKKLQEVEKELYQIKLDAKLNSLEEIEEYQEKLKNFQNKEYRNEILPLLGEVGRKMKKDFGEKIAYLKSGFDKEKDDVILFIKQQKGTKEEIVNKLEGGLINFNGDIKGKLVNIENEFLQSYDEKVKKVISEIFKKLRESNFAYEFELNSEILEKIKDNVLNITLYELSKDLNGLDIDVPKVDTSFWFFGDSEEEIKSKFLNYVRNRYFPVLENKVDGIKSSFDAMINKAFSKKIEIGEIAKEFNKAAVEPIDKKLKEKEMEFQELKEKIAQDKNRYEILNEELKRLSEIKKSIEKELG